MTPLCGDLIPRSSGLSNLGVNTGTNPGSFDISSISPYLLLAVLSGVFHDPLRGESGVIRYNTNSGIFEFSLNGGRSFIGVASHLDTSLQTAYQNGEVMSLYSHFGNFNIFGRGAKSIFATDSNRAPINISGIMNIPPLDITLSRPGHLAMLTHSITSGTPLKITELFQPVINAKSLGIPSLVLDTGSGIVNIGIGSGIAQFGTATAVTLNENTSTSGLGLGFETEKFADLNYTKGNASGIPTPPARGFIVHSPGLYRISYNVALDKTAGTGPDVVKVYVRRNTHESLKNGISYIQLLSTTNSDGSAHSSFLVEAQAGDYFTVFIAFVGSIDATDVVSTTAADTWCVVEKIGCRRNEARVEGI